MNLDNPDSNVPSTDANTSVRRTFLKRASAGAVIASIPGRSAWATSNGSIAASGHGSNFDQGDCTKLLGVTSFNNDSYRGMSFKHVFGGKPFDKHGNRGDDDFTFGQIFDAYNSNNNSNSNKNKRGINSVNVSMVVMYLNAINHDNGSGVFYPVLELHQNSKSVFASFLYNSAKNNAASTGITLNKTISEYSGFSSC